MFPFKYLYKKSHLKFILSQIIFLSIIRVIFKLVKITEPYRINFYIIKIFLLKKY